MTSDTARLAIEGLRRQATELEAKLADEHTISLPLVMVMPLDAPERGLAKQRAAAVITELKLVWDAIAQIQGFATEGEVHWSDWAQQPDIRIACDRKYTHPKWGGPTTDRPNVYRAECDRLYAFLAHEVTCHKCVIVYGQALMAHRFANLAQLAKHAVAVLTKPADQPTTPLVDGLQNELEKLKDVLA